MMSEHLSELQLAGYGRRTLDPEELLTVDRHLASCNTCHQKLNRSFPTSSRSVQVFNSSDEPFHLDYEQHLEPYVDGTADEVDREIVESHIAMCSNCADELADLIEFQQQPINAAGPPSTANKWIPQWQWPLMSRPTMAIAAVVALIILGLTIIIWATRSSRRPLEQAGPSSSKPDDQTDVANKQPSASPEDKQASQPSTQEQPLIALNDGRGQITLERDGHVKGLDQVPPDLRQSVEKILTTRRVGPSPALANWTSGSGTLRSGDGPESTLAPLMPINVVLENDRPTFRWTPLEGASNYTLTVYDSKLRRVESSGPLSVTEWTTSRPLARGLTYSWQISAEKEGKTIISPKPPLPEARFRVLDGRALRELENAKHAFGSSHLTLGILYWKHGLIERAEREFEALERANPDSRVAAELLANLRSQRPR